jgi:cyanate lyase
MRVAKMFKPKMLTRTFFTNTYPNVPSFSRMTPDPRWNMSTTAQWNPQWNPSTSWMTQGMVPQPVVPQMLQRPPVSPHEMQQQISEIHRQLDQFHIQQRQILQELRREQRDEEMSEYPQKYPGLATAARLNSGVKVPYAPLSNYEGTSFSGSARPYAPTSAPFFQAETGSSIDPLSHHHDYFPMNRCQIIEILMQAKREQQLTFKQIAERVGKSEVWTTSAMLGQQAFSEEQAETMFQILRIDSKMAKKMKLVLMEPPMRGSLNGGLPVDPTIYRFYEILQVYGTTLKALTHEKFGDGIMSAVNLEINLDKKKKQDGDYVEVTLLGEFEPFKKW